MSYLKQLNSCQQSAVLHQDGPLLVVAGAGAGKTRTIAYRILHLIESGVKPESILAITFTNKAAREMRERVKKLLENKINQSEGGNNQLQTEPLVTTFHSFGVYVLRKQNHHLAIPRHFSILDRNDSISKIKEAMRSLNLEEKRFEPAKILGTISRLKGDGLNCVQFQTENNHGFWEKIVSQVWFKYEEILKNNRALDFDDLLLKTVDLFKKQPAVLANYQNQFRYLHIDEYQDTNTIQYELANLLANKHKNICVVGDADQSIYSWRGADFTNLLRFEKDYPSAKLILLEENYRSTQTILAAANQVIEKNTWRYKKNLFTQNQAGDRISLYTSLSETEEAFFVASKIKNLLSLKKNPDEIAVLYRANFQSRILEEACLQNNLPYQVLGTRFFERKEIKDIAAFIRAGLDPEDWDSVKRVINLPARGIGKVTLLKLASGQLETLPATTKQKIKQFQEILADVGQTIKNQPLSEAIKFIIKRTGLEADFKKDGSDGLERLENIRELVNVATKYDHLPPEEAVENLMTEIALATDQDELSQTKKGVKLMTVHAAKGLEFDYVFITGLEQDLFPHSNLNKNNQDQEEERRLFYVALTRARRKLFLSYAQTRQVFGRRRVNLPSEFIFDIDENLLEIESGLETII